MSKMVAQMFEPSVAGNTSRMSNSELEGRIDELSRSVSEVYKYELLTTNQYLKQMELVMDIFEAISEQLRG